MSKYLVPVTEKDFAVLKAITDHDQKTNIQYAEIVRAKVDLLLELINCLHEEAVQLPEWLTWSEPVIVKLGFHSYTFLDTFSGTNLKHKGKIFKIFDEPSALILFRTILENYLTFYYLFADSISDEEKEFRVNVWRYCGLNQRSTFNIQTEAGKLKQAQEKAIVEQLKEIVCNHPLFAEFKKEEQKEILKGKKPRLFNSWDKLIKLSKFRGDLFQNLYGYKSNYTHSEFISVLQIHCKNFSLNVSEKEHYTLFLLHVIICKAITELSNVFPNIKVYFQQKDQITTNEVDYFYDFALNENIKY
jgi:hypothetical protein